MGLAGPVSLCWGWDDGRRQDPAVDGAAVIRTAGSGSWAHVIRQAETFDRAGVDRLVLSDHVVFGEHLDAYGRPEIGGSDAVGANPPVPTATGSSRSRR